MSQNDLKELEKLYAKPKTYKIPKNPKEGQVQASIVIKPFEIDEIASINFPGENASLEETAKFARTFFSKAMGVEEDKCKFSVEFMKELIDAVVDANGLTEGDMKKSGVNKIKDFIALKQKAIGQEKENGTKPADRKPEEPNTA